MKKNILRIAGVVLFLPALICAGLGLMPQANVGPDDCAKVGSHLETDVLKIEDDQTGSLSATESVDVVFKLSALKFDRNSGGRDYFKLDERCGKASMLKAAAKAAVAQARQAALGAIGALIALVMLMVSFWPNQSQRGGNITSPAGASGD